MKARAGFVSNSSSSSFVIIGKKIPMADIEKYDDVYFIGENCDGYEVIAVDADLKKVILDNNIDGEFWHSYYNAFDEDNVLSKDVIKMMAESDEDVEVAVMEVTQGNSYDDGVDEFLRNYLQDYYDPSEEEESDEE